MTDYPFRPDHEDASVRAMQADRRAVVSQIPRSAYRRPGPAICTCRHPASRHALHTDDHPCRACGCLAYEGTAA